MREMVGGMVGRIEMVGGMGARDGGRDGCERWWEG